MRRPLIRAVAAAFLVLLAIWLVTAYLLAPVWWKVHLSRHPVLTNGPRITRTGAGIPGDPLNISIIGSEDDLLSALLEAGWYPADPITLKSSLRIAESTIFKVIGSAADHPASQDPQSRRLNVTHAPKP